MLRQDFKLTPLPGSKFHFRIRLWDTKEEMGRAAVAEGSMTGEAQACFAGLERHEIVGNRVGDVYLFSSSSVWADAVHELTHAGVHYVREIRSGDLMEPHCGEYASATEELLCRSMEHMVVELFVQLARFKNAGSPQGGLTGML